MHAHDLLEIISNNDVQLTSESSNSSLGCHLLLTCPFHAAMEALSAISGLIQCTSAVYSLTVYIIDLRGRSQGFQEFAEYVSHVSGCMPSMHAS
jgi:hypothetical protein